jgi:hypothetical protein
MFKGEKVAPGSVIYFRVEGVAGRIQEKFEQLRALGVQVEREPQCIARGWHGHDVWLAFFRDPFGNLLSLKSDVPVTTPHPSPSTSLPSSAAQKPLGSP